MSTKNVIFDIGGVLMDWDPHYMYIKLIPDPEKRAWFLENICNDEWNMEQDRGRPFAEATELLVSQHPDYEELIRAYWPRWIEMIGGTFEGTVDILRELKEKGIPVYAITNFSAETMPIAQVKYDYLNWFDDWIVSGAHKLLKPDAEIYHVALKRFGVEGAESVFIDNSLPNVEGSIAAGLPAIHFTSSDKLRSDLRALGLPV